MILLRFSNVPTFVGDVAGFIRVSYVAHWARADSLAGSVEGAICVGTAGTRFEAGVDESF